MAAESAALTIGDTVAQVAVETCEERSPVEGIPLDLTGLKEGCQVQRLTSADQKTGLPVRRLFGSVSC